MACAQFVKTSTGFGTGGGTVEHVSLMRKSIPSTMSVKASGGIRTLEDLEKMVAAGATRIGASSGKKIIEEYKSFDAYIWSYTNNNIFIYKKHQQGQWEIKNNLSDVKKILEKLF